MSPRLERYVRSVFAPNEQAEALQLLAALSVPVWGHAAETAPTASWQDGDNLTMRSSPIWHNTGEFFLLSAVVASRGTLAGLRAVETMALQDGRDVIVVAEHIEPGYAGRMDEILGSP